MNLNEIDWQFMEILLSGERLCPPKLNNANLGLNINMK